MQMLNSDRFIINVHKSLTLASYTITTLILKKRKAIAKFREIKQQLTAILQGLVKRRKCKEWGVLTTQTIVQ